MYNERLQRQIDNQMKRIAEIDESIDQVTVIQRQMTPLVIRMIDGLEKFVELDVPFHMEERQQRISFLRGFRSRSIMVHELVHALQDQHYGLEALDPEDSARTVEGWPAPRRVVVTATAP